MKQLRSRFYPKKHHKEEMNQPRNNHFSLRLGKDQTNIEITILTASPDKAIKIYERLEQILIDLTRADLDAFQCVDSTNSSKNG